jgi:hypothetical protein
MPRPPKPVPGEEIRHDTFGQAVIVYAGENLRFVRNKQGTATAVSNTGGVATATALELTQLPPNEPKMRFAFVSALVRGAGNQNTTMSVADFDATTVGVAYTSGTTIGGDGGPWMVPITASSPNRRSIKWAAGATDVKCWVYCWGWWEAVG